MTLIGSCSPKLTLLPVWTCTIRSSLTDFEQKQSEARLHASSCCRPSLDILPPSTTSLPGLSCSPQISFSLHRSSSGPLQPLCSLPVPHSSLCLPFSSRKTELRLQGEESPALPLLHVGPQWGALSGGALPCWARLWRLTQWDECSFLRRWEVHNTCFIY